MGVHRKENLVLKKDFFIYVSMGVHRKEKLFLSSHINGSTICMKTCKKNSTLI